MSAEQTNLADSIKKVHQQLRRDVNESMHWDTKVNNLEFYS